MRARRLLAILAALAVVLLALPASGAAATHELEATFTGADAPNGPFQYILGLATDSSGGPSDGDVWVGELREGSGEGLRSSITKFDESGGYNGVVIDGSNTPAGSMSLINFEDESEQALLAFNGIAVDGSGGVNNGDVYVTDVEHHVINRFDEHGNYLCQITGSATPSATECNGLLGSQTPAGRIGACGLTVDPVTGNLYAADTAHHVIDEFSPQGALIRQISDPHLTRPTEISLTPNGDIWVLNGWWFQGESVVRFGPTGNFLGVLVGESLVEREAKELAHEPQAPEPFGLTVDRPLGHAYIYFAGAFHEYDENAVELSSFAPAEPGQFTSMATSAETGRIYTSPFKFQEGAVEIWSPGLGGPTVTMEPLGAAGETSIAVQGNVDPAGNGEVLSCRIEYGIGTFDHFAPCEPAPPYAGATAVSATLTGLTPSSYYEVRLAAANGGTPPYTRGVYAHSATQNFVTTGAPSIDAESSSEVSRFGATLEAKINPHGFDSKFRFEFVDAAHFAESGYASAATRRTSFSQIGEGIKPLAVSQGISGLEKETTYHYRAVAVNPKGEVKGPDMTFTTTAVATIEREWAYAHVRSALVEARINPIGLDSSCKVEWVGAEHFNASGYAGANVVPCAKGVGAGAAPVEVAAPLQGLEIDSEYHFRFVVTNSSGTVTGADETFSTWGFESYEIEFLDKEGNPYTQAGGTPYEKVLKYHFNHTWVAEKGGKKGSMAGFLKDLISEQPPGFTAGNAHAADECPGVKAEEENCPRRSQVGTVTVEYFEGEGIETRTRGLFEIKAPKGLASRYGSVDPYTNTDSRVRTGGDYGITSEGINVTEEARVVGATVVVWGVPADHLGPEACEGSACPRDSVLRNPTACEGPLSIEVRADSWQEPGLFTGTAAHLPGFTGCDQLEFKPSIEWQPTSTVADSPTGLHVDIHQPQNEGPEELSTAALRNVVMDPEGGVILNPSGAKGLVGCTPQQFGLHAEAPSHCPDAAKVGSLEIDTPTVDHALHGGIYMATPHDNPFGSTFAIYLAIADEESGMNVKLAGKIDTDPSTGALTASFSDDPQVPVEDFKLDFYGGPRAVLRNPPVCGTYITRSSLTPWSAPASGPPAHPTDSFKITSGPGGRPCPATEAAAPNEPEFSAGTISPQAGTYSPFVLRVHREDGTQKIAGITVDPPPGVLGKLAGIPHCPEAAIEAARQMTGLAERATPSCPGASAVGSVTVAAGAGSDPFYADGDVYLAGPYKGAPLSLAVIVPAVAGPFDLGNVVVRTPIQVDLEQGRIKVQSDPLPTVMEGVSLDLRTVVVSLDRKDFTINPTGCKPSSTRATVTTMAGQIATLGAPFQAGSCKQLGFDPRVSLQMGGKTVRRAHPSLHTVVRMPAKTANIARVSVTLPPTEFLDNTNIRGICTRAQFAAQNCPASSVYGHAEVWSPLLEEPLQGPVIMRSSRHSLPDMVAELNGEFRLAVAGRLGSGDGRIKTFVEGVPDAPISKFEMTIAGGPHGLLQNSVDACASRLRARIEMEAQNGRVAVLHPRLAAHCPAG